jgi:hypothetical protein
LLLIGLQCLILFPWLEYKFLWFVIIFLATGATGSVWERHYKELPTTEEKRFSKEASPDPGLWKDRIIRNSYKVSPKGEKNRKRRGRIIK